MNVPTPLECVNAEADESRAHVTSDVGESAAERRHKRLVELMKVVPPILLALAALVTALR